MIWPWGQWSRSHEGHYSTWHTALWSCTHIPNIIDLSRKTKMLWPGQENTIQKTIIWPWGQSPTKVITVRDTPPYDHAPTYQISLTYLERQKGYGPDKLCWEEAEAEGEEAEAEEKIRLKQYVSLRSKGRYNYYQKSFIYSFIIIIYEGKNNCIMFENIIVNIFLTFEMFICKRKQTQF
jgi:hypothetical protein